MATSKAELLRDMDAGRVELETLLAGIGEAHMDDVVHDDEHGWTAKDLLTHILTYERWTAAMLNATRRGTPATAQELYGADVERDIISIPDLTERNEELRALYRDQPPAAVRAAARAAYDDLVTAIDALSEQQLADPDFLPQAGGRSLLDVMPFQTYKHYAKHLQPFRDLRDRVTGDG